MRSLRLTYLGLVGLAFLVSGVAHAQSTYTLQPIVKAGDTVAGLPIDASRPMFVSGLNDRGHLLFRAPSFPDQLVFFYADGAFTPLVVGDGEAPGGKWPQGGGVANFGDVNERGSLVFSAHVEINNETTWNSFFWDAQTRKLTGLAVPGMPAVNNLTFLSSVGEINNPVINNQDEILFGGTVADTAGNPKLGIFFIGRDRVLHAVVLPGQELPGGGTMLQNGGILAVNDAGVAAFIALRSGDPSGAFSAYQWENGTLAPLAVVGASAPGGGTITRVNALRLNNRDRGVLLALRTSTHPTSSGLYRLAEGRLAPLAVPGQEMPGGGKLQTVLEEYPTRGGVHANGDVSPANGLGQHVFRARLEDGTRALYRLDPDGKLTLLLKQGMTTGLGAITELMGGQGIGFNSQGQIALTLRIAGGPQALFLLTPAGP